MVGSGPLLGTFCCTAEQTEKLGSSPVLFGSWQVQLKFEDLMAWSLHAQAEAYS